ncbi:MAG: cytochrome c oxidase subunit 3 family protein [Phycisphaerae bacterium]
MSDSTEREQDTGGTAVAEHPGHGDPHAAHAGHAHAGHGDSHHAHDPHLAHHFDTPEQQFNSAKVGMWVFLATELLMFGGLFCAYAVYRAQNPEIFLYGHHHLSTTLGTINTVILLASSLTMALGVRYAQLANQKMLVIMLGLTLMGGVGFLVIKTIEYTDKFQKGFAPGVVRNVYSESTRYEGDAAARRLPGTVIAPYGEDPAAGPAEQDAAADHADAAATTGLDSADAATGQALAPEVPHGDTEEAEQQQPETAGVAQTSLEAMRERGQVYVDPNFGTADAARIQPNFATTPRGMRETAPAVSTTSMPVEAEPLIVPQGVYTFFGIYYIMTGLHGVHVLVGMGLIGWIMVRAIGGAFSASYYTPVDLVGLYWHLVDLIWIFLFPLLYLIH